MSFKYEAITDEVSKKVDCQNKYKDIIFVTPLEYSEAFPIKLSGDGHCVLTERFVKFYLAFRIFYQFHVNRQVQTFR